MLALVAIRLLRRFTGAMSNKNAAFAANPTPLSTGNPEMPVYYTNQDPPRITPHTAPSITPYLGLRSRLSQVWINRWTILLLLVLARVLIAISGMNNDLASARREALSACSGVEDMGSAMASMPHYMSQGVNELAATGVEKAVNGLMDMTTLSVTGVEELVVFVINMMTSTYVCLITLAVSGSLHVALQVVEDAANFLNTTLGDIGNDISGSVSTFETAWNSFLKDIDSGLSDITGKQLSPPSLNLNASMTALAHLTLPSSLDEGLTKLNQSIPTFAQVNNFTNNAIKLPFEEIKKAINQSYSGYTFDRSLLPVPDKQALTFCSDNDGINDFFNDLAKLANMARKIFIVVLVLAAILVCIPMAWREVRRWRTMQERSKLVRSNAHDPMDVVYIVSRPYTSTTGVKVASNFQSSRRQILTRWVIAYATSLPALFVLSLGVAGLFSCLCQFVLLKSLQKEVPQLTNQVGAFADKVVDRLNNASQQWAIGTNDVISTTNTNINNDLFGWVNISTTAINDTLNTFVDDMTNVLNTTFGGTVLYDPITEVLNCLITLKIVGVEKGLTWIQDNAHIDFPLLPNNTFSLGAADSLLANSTPDSSFLAQPGSDASDQISAAVSRLTTVLAEGIRTEALISTFVVLLWFFILFAAIIRALTLWFGRDKLRGEGGEAYIIDSGHNTNSNDVPMRTVQVIDERGPPKYQPSPSVTEYQADRNDPFAHEDDYQAQKLGFAGQREYDTLPVDDSKRGHIQRMSSYGEVVGNGDMKR